MNREPKISIILPLSCNSDSAINTLNHLTETLFQSAHRHSFQELIIVNQSPKDDVLNQVLLRWMKHPKIPAKKIDIDIQDYLLAAEKGVIQTFPENDILFVSQDSILADCFFDALDSARKEKDWNTLSPVHLSLLTKRTPKDLETISKFGTLLEKISPQICKRSQGNQDTILINRNIINHDFAIKEIISDKTLKHYWAPSAVFNSPLDSEALEQELTVLLDELKPFTNFQESLLHNRFCIHLIDKNPYGVVSRTSQCIRESFFNLSEEFQVSTVMLFPDITGETPMLNLYVDDKHIGSFSLKSINFLINFFVSIETLDIISVNVHGGTYWPANLLDTVIKLIPCNNRNQIMYNYEDLELALSSKFSKIVSPTTHLAEAFGIKHNHANDVSVISPYILTKKNEESISSNEKISIILLSTTKHEADLYWFRYLVEKFGDRFRWVHLATDNYFFYDSRINYEKIYRGTDTIACALKNSSPGFLLHNTSFPEAFPYSFYEALVSGVAVIETGRNDVIRSALAENNLGVCLKSFESFLDYLNCSDDVLLQEINHFSESFDFELNISGLKQCYLQQNLTPPRTQGNLASVLQ